MVAEIRACKNELFLIQFENVFICLTEIFFCKVENVPNFFIFFSFLLIIFLRVEVLFASRCCLLNFFLFSRGGGTKEGHRRFL